MGWEYFDVIRFDLGFLLQGQMRIAKLKVLITRLLLVPEACNVKPSYRKSWAGNLLMWSDLTLSPSFKVKRGQKKLKSTYNLLIIDPSGLKYEKQLVGYHGLGIF